jgi:PIN domain nuclease of toxin-antitoxin system
MKRYVTDTHSLIWHIFDNPKLSKRAKSIFEKTDYGEYQVYIPIIVLVEIVYLMEKSKIPVETVDKVINLLDKSPINYRLFSMNLETIHHLKSISRDLIPDMPDRIIAATALELALPLITKDKKIEKSDIVKIIW